MRKMRKIFAITVLIAALIASVFVAPITMASSGKAVKIHNKGQHNGVQSFDKQEDNSSNSSDEGTTNEEHENETSSEEPEHGTNNETEEEHEEHEEGVTHEVEDEEEEHELHMVYEEGKVKIVSDDNEIEFRRDKPKLQFKYVSENGSEIQFEVRFKEIYEFVDTNGNGKLDSGEKVFEMDLEDLPWSVELKNGTYVEINCTWYEVTYSYVSDDFDVTFVVHVYQKSMDETDGGADAAKIDVVINKWNWHDANSLLATLIKMEIESETEGQIQELASTEANETGIYMKAANNVFIKYEWTNEILVNNETSSIVASYYKKIELEQEMEQEENITHQQVQLEVAVFTVYPHFETLRHDPTVGIEDDPADVQKILQEINVSLQWYIQPKMLAIIGIFATVIVAAAALLKKNNNKKLKSIQALI